MLDWAKLYRTKSSTESFARVSGMVVKNYGLEIWLRAQPHGWGNVSIATPCGVVWCRWQSVSLEVGREPTTFAPAQAGVISFFGVTSNA